MSYWLLVTSGVDFRHDRDVLKFKLLGLPSRNKKSTDKMKKGDKIVYYIKKEMKIGAISEVIGSPYEDYKQIWVGSGYSWPLRCETKQYLALKDNDLIDIRELVPHLSFIRIKDNWSCYFQGSLKHIPEDDYKIIESKMHKARK